MTTDQEPRPELEEIETGYLVSIPHSGGWTRFNFEEMEQKRSRMLEADLTVWQELPGLNNHALNGRLDILSLSQRESYRRQLDDGFGKGGWTTLLNRACQMAKQAWERKDWSVDLAGVSVEMEVQYAIHPILFAELPTVLFGAGESGKTYVALWLAVGVILGLPLFDESLHVTGSVLMVDYEATERDIKRRLLRLGLKGFERFVYWPARGRPLPDMVHSLQRKLRERDDVRFIIIDSAALACGGDPKEESVATNYFNGLAKLGLPSLTTAHMTKDEKDDVHPFGSVFWFNHPRMVWNIKGGDPEMNPKHIGLFPRKFNEDARAHPHGLRMAFTGESVEINPEGLDSEFSRYLSLSQRIRTALRQGGKSVKALSGQLDAKENEVRARLSDMNDTYRLGLATDGSGLWGLRAHE